MNFTQLIRRVNSEEEAVRFFQEYHILPTEMMCENGHQMTLSFGVKVRWRCSKRTCRVDKVNSIQMDEITPTGIINVRSEPIIRKVNNAIARHIILNVGGQRFETSTETLRRIPDTRLTKLLDESADGIDEIFVDRCGEIFYLVLNFLRIGTIETNAIGENNHDLIERLEKEARFYGISELANFCRLQREPLKAGEMVVWCTTAIQHYWRPFVNCILDKSLVIPFTFERNATFFTKCVACGDCVEPKQHNTYLVNFDEWSPLIHHMEIMNGKVEKVLNTTCVLIKWSNSTATHLPRSSVRRLIPLERQKVQN